QSPRALQLGRKQPGGHPPQRLSAQRSPQPGHASGGEYRGGKGQSPARGLLQILRLSQSLSRHPKAATRSAPTPINRILTGRRALKSRKFEQRIMKCLAESFTGENCQQKNLGDASASPV